MTNTDPAHRNFGLKREHAAATRARAVDYDGFEMGYANRYTLSFES